MHTKNTYTKLDLYTHKGTATRATLDSLINTRILN